MEGLQLLQDTAIDMMTGLFLPLYVGMVISGVALFLSNKVGYIFLEKCLAFISSASLLLGIGSIPYQLIKMEADSDVKMYDAYEQELKEGDIKHLQGYGVFEYQGNRFLVDMENSKDGVIDYSVMSDAEYVLFKDRLMEKEKENGDE